MKLVPLQKWELGFGLLCFLGLPCHLSNVVRGPPAASLSQGLLEAGPREPERGGTAEQRGHLLCPPGQDTCST